MNKPWVKNIGLAIIVAGIAVGWKLWNKSESEDGTKADLVTICADDKACLKAVDTHFEACHEEAYSIGSRRRAGGLDSSKLVRCINDRSGKAYFAVE